jgi:hypothetical protein
VLVRRQPRQRQRFVQVLADPVQQRTQRRLVVGTQRGFDELRLPTGPPGRGDE